MFYMWLCIVAGLCSMQSLAFVMPKLQCRSPFLMSTVSPSSTPSSRYPELVKCLTREYLSFFNPLDRKFYCEDVEFIDPLNSFRGIEKYQKNVDMLAGRTAFGSFLFDDASIALHKVDITGERQLETRWTLQVTVKSIPYKPRAKFTGISRYTLDSTGKVMRQEDFWDSVNLINGEYKPSKSFKDGLMDFLGQLKKDDSATMSAPELPYELLRRAKYYDVRRYPAHTAIETLYTQRPEGYDRLGSYVGGSNVRNERLTYYSPTLMRIEDDPVQNTRRKTMTWPMRFTLPGAAKSRMNSRSSEEAKYLNADEMPAPTIPRVNIVQVPARVVAVLRFEAAATEVIARKCTADLRRCLQNDGLVPLESDDDKADGDGVGGQEVEKDSRKVITVAQFDALFSLNKRRIEVWVDLHPDKHPWC